MCNAWNHQDDCECGFGPPYDYIEIKHYRIASPRAARTTSLAGRFHISIPVADISKPDDLDQQVKQALTLSLEEQLRAIAQKSITAVSRTAQLKVQIKRLTVGTLGVHFDMLIVGGAIYTFFVNYESFKKGITMFRTDLVKASRHVIRVMNRTTRAAKRKSDLITLDLHPKANAQKSISTSNSI
jgi:hypothetical protein